jgi:transposase
MLFLPAYSPELNPIEHKWNELKQNLKKSYDNSISFLDNIISKVNSMSCLI